ncbi:Uncharacterised protein [Mycobacteroides abscessus subsp. abscessus]|nr:Uncharacterised protein [Mycobacteroides abscessus subsp. abscessus]
MAASPRENGQPAVGSACRSRTAAAIPDHALPKSSESSWSAGTPGTAEVISSGPSDVVAHSSTDGPGIR